MVAGMISQRMGHLEGDGLSNPVLGENSGGRCTATNITEALTPACSHHGLCLAFLLPLLFFPQALLSANSPEPQKITFHLLFGTAQGSSSLHGQRGKG